jgi:hypothetical protein
MDNVQKVSNYMDPGFLMGGCSSTVISHLFIYLSICGTIHVHGLGLGRILCNVPSNRK